MTQPTDNEIRMVYLFLVNEDQKGIETKISSLPKGEIHKNIPNIRVLKKIADQSDEKEFIESFRNNEYPAVKLTSGEQELLKGGVWVIGLIVMVLKNSSYESRCLAGNTYA